jgi:hypothetical protein
LRETKNVEQSTLRKHTNWGRGREDTDNTGELVGGNRRIKKTTFEVLTAVLLRILGFCVVTLCH